MLLGRVIQEGVPDLLPSYNHRKTKYYLRHKSVVLILMNANLTNILKTLRCSNRQETGNIN